MSGSNTHSGMKNVEAYATSYRDVLVHKMMLEDVIRTEAYERALQRYVEQGTTVIDFGCGTSILSIFASRFGAKQVFAVDRSPFIKTAEAIARLNGADNVKFFHGDHKTVSIPEQADILVSEWMGHFIFYEQMLEPLIHIRDKFLKAGGIMIPSEVTLYAGLVTDESVYEHLGFFKENPYDVDFSPIEDDPFFETSLETFLPNQLLKSVANLGTLDLSTIKAAPDVVSGTVVPEKEAVVYGLCGWFSAKLADDIILGTGPDDPITHWNQIFFPFLEPIKVTPQRELTIRISPPYEDGMPDPSWSWSISDGERSVHMNDYEHREKNNI